jgi:carbamoyl-phosphate synthase large subunit
VDAIERQQYWQPSVRPLQSYAREHRSLKLFIRQPLTQSGDDSKAIVDAVLQIVDDIGKDGIQFEYLTGSAALSDRTFRENFEQSQGVPFSPSNFRRYRLGQLRRADAFLYIRTAMSESGAFEISYNIFAEPRAPMFFAVWKHAPIKTTLLRELEEVCDVTYCEFEDPEELRGALQRFFRQIGKGFAAPGLVSRLPRLANRTRAPDRHAAPAQASGAASFGS